MDSVPCASVVAFSKELSAKLMTAKSMTPTPVVVVLSSKPRVALLSKPLVVKPSRGVQCVVSRPAAISGVRGTTYGGQAVVFTSNARNIPITLLLGAQ